MYVKVIARRAGDIFRDTVRICANFGVRNYFRQGGYVIVAVIPPNGRRGIPSLLCVFVIFYVACFFCTGYGYGFLSGE